MDDVTDSIKYKVGMQFADIFFFVKLEIGTVENVLAGLLTILQRFDFLKISQKTKFVPTIVFPEVLIKETGN